jgi:hypothetical protein
MLKRVKLAALITSAVLAGLVAHRRLRDWGATPAERRSWFPGDELIRDPADTVTLAVGIEAPAAEVWRWLTQIGVGRGGMYSYDWLENLIGLDIHSAETIHEEWQHLSVGDRVVLVPDGWMGMKRGYSLPVVATEVDRSLVLRQSPPEHPWDATWSFVITPAGPDRCRLVSRSRAARQPGLTGMLMRLAAQTMEPITLMMTRKMLVGIKERAERDSRNSGPLSPL